MEVKESRELIDDELLKAIVTKIYLGEKVGFKYFENQDELIRSWGIVVEDCKVFKAQCVLEDEYLEYLVKKRGSRRQGKSKTLFISCRIDKSWDRELILTPEIIREFINYLETISDKPKVKRKFTYEIRYEITLPCSKDLVLKSGT